MVNLKGSCSSTAQKGKFNVALYFISLEKKATLMSKLRELEITMEDLTDKTGILKILCD